jgi:hypothetical protein
MEYWNDGMMEYWNNGIMGEFSATYYFTMGEPV